MRRLLLLSFVGIALLALAVSTVPLALFIQSVERDRLLTTLERDAFVIAGKAEEALESLTYADLLPVRELTQEYRDAGGARVVIVNSEGTAVVTNDPEENRVGISYLSRAEFGEALEGRVSTGERFSETLGITLVYVAVPVYSGAETVGAVRLTFDKAVIDEEVNEQLAGIAVVALSTLAISALLAIILSLTLSRGVRNLDRAAAALSAGNLNERAREDEGPPELRALARSFNLMSERLGVLMDQQKRFASDASHQLRTPLTALRLRIEGLREALNPKGKNSERFDAIEAEISRLTRLIDGLLALGRAGSVSATVETIDASAVVRERVEGWQLLADEASRSLVWDISPGITVEALPTALEQIVDVYLDNALSLTPERGTIRVSLSTEQGHVTLAVEDEGPGISEEDARRAFDRFWRGQSSYEGTGLGLAIVQQLADASGATVSLRPRADRIGARAEAVFRVSESSSRAPFPVSS